MNALERKGKITVGYLGGSITEGAGASFPETTSWRALVTQWYRQRYPHSEVCEVSAAIGGTGSDLGVFRIGMDLLAFRPDVVFVEFAVNDQAVPVERVMRSMEGIVRQVWLSDPLTQIIFVNTIAWPMVRVYLKGESPPSILAHQRVANYYGIPVVQVGKVFLEAYQNGRRWDELTIDDVHPSDEGHNLYASRIIDFLDSKACPGAVCSAGEMPAPLYAQALDRARVISAHQLQVPGWSVSNMRFTRQINGVLTCSQPGAKLVFPFHGTTVGLYWLVSIDSGDVIWRVDGQKEQKTSSWDEWALQYTRPGYQVLSDRLAPGPHTLSLRVQREHALRSTGTWIRLGGILVG